MPAKISRSWEKGNLFQVQPPSSEASAGTPAGTLWLGNDTEDNGLSPDTGDSREPAPQRGITMPTDNCRSATDSTLRRFFFSCDNTH